MGHLSTHVLDTAYGCPAAGMQVTLQRLDATGAASVVKSLALNHDGRADGPLLDATAMAVGRYRLVFEVAPYFRARGVSRRRRTRPSASSIRSPPPSSSAG